MSVPRNTGSEPIPLDEAPTSLSGASGPREPGSLPVASELDAEPPGSSEQTLMLGQGCVLYIGTWWVEWLGVDRKGRAVHVREEVDGEHPAEFVSAALAAIRRAGMGRRPCVLALADTHAPERRVDVPPLRRKELQQVLERKAAQLLECGLEDTLYSARAASSQRGAADETGLQPWIVVAMRRSFVVELSNRLRRHGLRVRKIVSARYARLSALIQAFAAEDAPARQGPDASDAAPRAVGTVVVDVELHSITIHLTHGPNVISDSQLAGSFQESPGLAVSLLQELRGLEAHWRKISRGGQLGRAVFAGLSAVGADRIRIAVATALPGVECSFLSGERDDAARARQASLAACAGQGPFDLDLTVQLPRRPSVAAFLVLIVACLLGSVGVVAHAELSTRLVDLEAQEAALLGATGPLPELQDRAQDLEQGLARLAAETARAQQVLGLGLPLEDFLVQLFEVLAADADLQALTVTRSGETHNIRISGRTHSHPLRGLEALKRIESELTELPGYEQVELQPPTLTSGQGSSTMPFEITACMRGFLLPGKSPGEGGGGQP